MTVTDDIQEGSSPLARSLRRGLPESGRVGQIIPARAGFTTRPCRTPRPCRDHPRSRGVYLRNNVRYIIAGGSSPLARGLRDAGPCVYADGWDHPRSRGVYFCMFCRGFRNPGSSPLARGLRPRVPALGEPRGIIPARAGFTRPHGRVRRGPRDHPRSRGVYRLYPAPTA